jgi:hypothetical protein
MVQSPQEPGDDKMTHQYPVGSGSGSGSGYGYGEGFGDGYGYGYRDGNVSRS